MVRKTTIYAEDSLGKKTEVCIKTHDDRKELAYDHKRAVEAIMRVMSDQGCGYIQDYKIK